MSAEPKKSPSHIRTFAKDLDFERSKRDTVGATEHKTSKESLAVPLKEVPVDDKLQDSIKSKPVPKPELKPIPKVSKEKTSEPKEAQTKIPSFHELQMQVDLIQKNNPTKMHEDIKASDGASKKQLAKTEKESTTQPKRDSEFVHGGTIITDTKNERFELLPSIFTSIKKWFDDYRAESRRKSAPKYVVPETNHRKGVIQKATSKTGTIFTADNETIKERIRHRQQNLTKLEEEENEPETSWSPYTETGYTLLEAPDEGRIDATSNVVVEYKKPSATQNSKAATIVKKAEVDIPEIEIEKNKSQINTEPTIVEPTKKLAIAVPSEVDTKEQPNNESLAIEPPVVEKDKTDTLASPSTTLLSKLSNYKHSISNLNTNTLTIILLIIFIGVGVMLVSVNIIINQFFPESVSVSQIVSNREKLITNSKLIELKIESGAGSDIAEQIYTTLNESNDRLTEIVVVNNLKNEISPSELFKRIGFKTIPNLPQSITSVRFVKIDDSSTIIVISYVDDQTVRGGLLKWEKTMSKDLIDFYPNESDTTTSFKDGAISGIDVRILQNGDDTQLVYGLTDNLIIITSDRNTFARTLTSDFTR